MGEREQEYVGEGESEGMEICARNQGRFVVVDWQALNTSGQSWRVMNDDDDNWSMLCLKSSVDSRTLISSMCARMGWKKGEDSACMNEHVLLHLSVLCTCVCVDTCHQHLTRLPKDHRTVRTRIPESGMCRETHTDFQIETSLR